MATIDQTKLVRLVTPILCGAVSGEAEREFDNALSNLNTDGFSSRGIVICYGSSEGLSAIKRAYSGLKEEIGPRQFATEIARALQIFSEPFKEGQHNLTYAHFLLHGIQKPTVKEVIDKIVDNGRIIHESESARDPFIENFGTRSKKMDDTLHLCLKRGETDDFHGLSVRLFVAGQDGNYDYMAKTGFLIDTTNKSAIIINVQGRQIDRSKEQKARSIDAKVGRLFASLRSRYGEDLRTLVIKHLKTILLDHGFAQLKAIRPTEHVMHIGGHRGFYANYEAQIAAAGLVESADGLYFETSLQAKNPK